MSSFLKSAWTELAWVIRVSRPRFWIYLFGPFLIALVGVMRMSGFESGSFSDRVQNLEAIGAFLWRLCIEIVPGLLKTDPLTALMWIGVCVLFLGYPLLPANLLVYGVNDLYDAETDALNPKKNGYETRLSPTRRTRLVWYIVLLQLPWALGLGYTFFLPDIFQARFYYTAISLLIFLLLGVFYSAPPIRAKARPWLDSLSNGLYLFPALAGYFFFSFMAKDILVIPWLPLLAGWLWCMAMHAYSAVPDIEADTHAGIRTIATKLGARKTLYLCLGLYVGSSLVAVSSVHSSILRYIFLLHGLVYVILISISLTRTEDLLPVYKRFPLVNTLVGMTLFFALLLF